MEEYTNTVMAGISIVICVSSKFRRTRGARTGTTTTIGGSTSPYLSVAQYAHHALAHSLSTVIYKLHVISQTST